MAMQSKSNALLMLTLIFYNQCLCVITIGVTVLNSLPDPQITVLILICVYFCVSVWQWVSVRVW